MVSDRCEDAVRPFDTYANSRWTSHEAPNRTREEWKVPKKEALEEVKKCLSMRPMLMSIFTDAETILGLGIPSAAADCCGRGVG